MDNAPDMESEENKRLLRFDLSSMKVEGEVVVVFDSTDD